MLIRYTDTRTDEEIRITVDQGDDIYYNICSQYKSAFADGIVVATPGFDTVHIDLRSENIEVVACYAEGRKVLEFGGASAWNIYRWIASRHPQIDHHTTGRPPVIL